MRPRTNKLWKFPKEELQTVVKEAASLADILRIIGLTTKGTSNYHRLKKRLDEEGIDYSHIKLGRDSNRGREFGPRAKIPLEEVLIEGSDYSRTSLKKRLISEGVLENRCSKCGQEPEWEDEPLVMILDHINGVHDDNRKENLRLLCPNCNSQTDTFAGRGFRQPSFCECGRKKWKKAERCNVCEHKLRRQVERPDKDTLKNLLWSQPTSQLAKQFGVSDKAIEKWAKAYGLKKPPRGYWTKHGPVV